VTLRQVAIVRITPGADPSRLSVKALMAPEPLILRAAWVLTLALDLPCRRAPPTLQGLYHDTAEAAGEAALAERVAARLTALRKLGPVSVVSHGGLARDWPALKAAWLRHGIPGTGYEVVDFHVVERIGQDALEFIDLSRWVSRTNLTSAALGHSDPAEGGLETIWYVYQAFLGWLLVAGQMSRPVHQRAVDRLGGERRRLHIEMFR